MAYEIDRQVSPYCFSSSSRAVSECMDIFGCEVLESNIETFFRDVAHESSDSSTLKVPDTDTELVNWLQNMLPSFGFLGTAKVHNGDIMLSHRVHLLHLGTYVDHMITLSSRFGSYLLLPIENKGSLSGQPQGVRQVTIECANAIVSNSIMLGIPQDQPLFGLMIIGTRTTTLRVVRVQKINHRVNRFRVAISPELCTTEHILKSTENGQNASPWISRLLAAVTAYGMILETKLQEQILSNQSLTLTHLCAYDEYEYLLNILEDTDKWIVVNATPCKATVVKLDEDGSPVKFGCVHLGGPMLRIIKHPRERGPQWTMVFPKLFAVADPGGVNILKFDTSPHPVSIRLDQFVLLALEEILDVQQFDNADPFVEKVIHGDTRLPNFLFNLDSEHPSLCLIDFEYSSLEDSRLAWTTRARADSPQIPPPLRFQRGNAMVATLPSDDFYMFLYSLLVEIEWSTPQSVIRNNNEFGYQDFSCSIRQLSEIILDDAQRNLFVELLEPIAPNPPPEYQSFRKQSERRENLLLYEDQLYNTIRSHCERIRSGEFADLSFYGHPSELFVIKRYMGSRVMRKTVS
ncbi:hypothetical protein GEMRC1_003189 [Eukaryota sp. GEM-RC1]